MAPFIMGGRCELALHRSFQARGCISPCGGCAGCRDASAKADGAGEAVAGFAACEALASTALPCSCGQMMAVNLLNLYSVRRCFV